MSDEKVAVLEWCQPIQSMYLVVVYLVDRLSHVYVPCAEDSTSLQ